MCSIMNRLFVSHVMLDGCRTPRKFRLSSSSNQLLASSPMYIASVRHFSDVANLTHVDGRGKAAMVDISDKPITTRHAVAVGRVWLNNRAYSAVENNSIAKGDVLTMAKLAGIMGAKRCPDLIPLCHSLSLTGVDVNLSLNPELKSIDIEASAITADRTGVEMESLTAVSVAALTIYDMCKAVARDTVIGDIKLKQKSGGLSGDFICES